MKIINLVLTHNNRGFDIQGLQKSEAFKGKSIEDIGIHSINPDNERGSHYHKQKTEWLFPIKGAATIHWTEKLSPQRKDIKQTKIKADFDYPCLVEIPPFVVHWVKNNGPEVFIMAVFSTKEFNVHQPDNCKVQSLEQLR